MSRSTGTRYLSEFEGPGDYTFLLHEGDWLFEFGFYTAGRYFFLREEPTPRSIMAQVSRALAFFWTLLSFIFFAGLVILTIVYGDTVLRVLIALVIVGYAWMERPRRNK